ncbi:hypothetical protein [Mycolicibacterium neworleansense]|uniref:Integral membrane protein n=1 Tax=Mycolicibacterium neworleansense TaxID=146018 RepID=A0A0H5RID9_9MYCO|nr:hypothetical protein [Mycolicibacterium neworleansense]MCV7363096.1 hypothetical protein [Mycolicibacterium neworleansense]CRZ13940.1 hypothetical protein BN2156_00783 [Mycolicibacterium neworleansense]
MRSSEYRDTPDGWTDTHNGLRYYLSVAGLLAFAVISALFGIVAAAAGNFIALKYFLLFALLLVLGVAYGLVVRHRRGGLSSSVRTAIERDNTPGTEIRYSTSQFTILVALMGCCMVFCVMASVDILIHQDEGFPGFAVVTSALGIVFASFIASAICGRIRRGGVILSSQGIAQRGWSFESRLNWSDIAAVKAATNGYPVILAVGYANADWNRRCTTRLWRIDRLPPVPMIEFDCRQFDVDPYLLYSYVRTYAENPEVRAELGTEVALARARSLQPTR